MGDSGNNMDEINKLETPVQMLNGSDNIEPRFSTSVRLFSRNCNDDYDSVVKSSPILPNGKSSLPGP